MESVVHIKHGRMGLRMVAAFEASKGVLMLGLGFGFLALRHTGMQALTDMVRKLGVNPDAHYPRLFFDHLSQVGDRGLFWFAVVALVLSILRFAEATGLWFAMHWAEWLTFVSSGVYLPFEVRYIFVHSDLFGVVVLVVNLGIVYYLGHVLATNRRERKGHLQHAQPPTQPASGLASKSPPSNTECP